MQVCEDVIRWVPDLLPGSGQSLPRLSAAAAAKQARVLLRSTTTESSPALTQACNSCTAASPGPFGPLRPVNACKNFASVCCDLNLSCSLSASRALL